MAKKLTFVALLAATLVLSMGQSTVPSRTRLPNGANASGLLTFTATAGCTIANTTETDLWTYSLPANTLNVNGKAIRVTIWGDVAAAGGTKTIRTYFNGTSVAAVGYGGTNTGFKSVVHILRTGSSAQAAIGEIVGALAAPNETYTTHSATTSAAITIKFSGQNGVATANDVCFRGAIVETLG
jgi:hypothetical protein